MFPSSSFHYRLGAATTSFQITFWSFRISINFQVILLYQNQNFRELCTVSLIQKNVSSKPWLTPEMCNLI